MERPIPCPHCANQDIGIDHASVYGNLFHEDAYWAHCAECGARGPEEWTEEMAVKSWNLRTPYEGDTFFYLPKPKVDVAHHMYSGIERIGEGSYKAYGFADIIESNMRMWAEEIDGYLLKRMGEVLNPRKTCKDVWDVGHTGLLLFECSECGSVSLEIAPNYCPVCGAEVIQDGAVPE